MVNWHISHDFAYALGGAERVTAALTLATPRAQVVALNGSKQVFADLGLPDVRFTEPRWITERNYRPLSIAHACYASRVEVDGNLLASSYGFAHLARATGAKIAYMHSPLRQAWSGVDEYASSMRWPIATAWRRVAAPAFRAYDKRRSGEVAEYVATSRVVRRRIREYYGQDALIVPPPVDPVFTPATQPTEARSYLWVGRIVEPYKRLSLAIEAVRDSDRTLKVVGDGRDRSRLEALAPANVRFVGRLSGVDLAAAYASATALIMPSEDDFGMVVTEAISCGTPVVAWRGGGALDTVEEGRSGVFFREASSESLGAALDAFEHQTWSREEVAECGRRFSLDSFVRDMTSVVSRHS